MARPVVFDCMVFLQAAAHGASPSRACFREVEQGRARLLVSPEVMDEVRDVLNRPRLRERFAGLTDQSVETFLKHVSDLAGLFPNAPRHFELERDPKDEKYLNLAIEARADFIVSRDNDLLDLMTGQSETSRAFLNQHPQIRIVDPVAFLREIRPDGPRGREREFGR